MAKTSGKDQIVRTLDRLLNQCDRAANELQARGFTEQAERIDGTAEDLEHIRDSFAEL